MDSNTQDILNKKKKNIRKKSPSPISDYTHDGHPLSQQESIFINAYIETNNGSEAVKRAGYKTNTPHVQANRLLHLDYVNSEIRFRLDQIKEASIASADEIMQYFTSVMRGEVKDQFGLEASLGERTKAAQELAKRRIDMPNKLEGRETPEVKITLNWDRGDK